MKTRLFTALALLGLIALPLSAQQDSQQSRQKDRLNIGKVTEGEHNGLPGMWTCIVGGADKAITMIKLTTVTSVSKQTYLLEGRQRILEVTIDTTGNNSIRFYCMADETSKRAANNSANIRSIVEKHTGNDARFPAKQYPHATHSHNVEFQLATEGDVNRVYESVTHAWVKNTSQTIRVNN